MEKITVKKADLLAALRKNREEHRAIFEEALEGYRTQAIALLEDRLRMLHKGQPMSVAFELPEPQDQTKDYDRVIRMMELSVEDEISLSEADFAQYVMDDWKWQRQFLVSNRGYSVRADTRSKLSQT